MSHSRKWEVNQTRQKRIDDLKQKLQSEIDAQGDIIHGIEWVFSEEYRSFPISASYDIRQPIPKNIASWGYIEIEDCTQAIIKGDLKARSIADKPDGALTSGKGSVATPSMEAASIKSKLITFIESKLGRKILIRIPTSFNPTVNDLTPPNSFEWCFTSDYLAFPKKGPSRWTKSEIENCLEALNRGWLDLKEANSSNKDTWSGEGPAAQNLEKMSSPDINLEFFEAIEATLGGLRRGATEGIAKSQDFKTSFYELKTSFESDLHAAAKITTLVEKHRSILHALLTRSQAKITALESKVQRLESAIDDAQRIGQEKAVMDIKESHLAQLSNHLTLLRKARQEARMEGLLEGQQSAGSSDFRKPMELLRQQHAIKLIQAREEGRIAGRESSQNVDDALVNLLEENNINHGRKARELRTIYQNWNDIPQNILPEPMLTTGKVPGDRTLIQLAQLSKLEKDPRKAHQLLQQEIENRIRDATSAAAHTKALTNPDISRALAKLDARRTSQTPSDTNALAGSPATVVAGIPSNSQVLGTQDSQESLVPSISLQPCDGDTSKTMPVHIIPAQPSNPGKQKDVQSVDEGDSLSDVLKNMVALIDDEHTLSDVLTALLPEPELPEGIVPVELPLDFVRTSIGGNDYTFARCGSRVRDHQVINWPQMIKLNLDVHKDAPTFGTHGALTYVDGRSKTGEIGVVYPTLQKTTTGYKYIGHYKVVARKIVPTEFFQKYSQVTKHSIGEEIESSLWGQSLLAKKGLTYNATDKLAERIESIINFFLKTTEPCLRMSWTILQFSRFDRGAHDLLSAALKRWEAKSSKTPSIEKLRFSFSGPVRGRESLEGSMQSPYRSDLQNANRKRAITVSTPDSISGASTLHGSPAIKSSSTPRISRYTDAEIYDISPEPSSERRGQKGRPLGKQASYADEDEDMEDYSDIPASPPPPSNSKRQKRS